MESVENVAYSLLPIVPVVYVVVLAVCVHGTVTRADKKKKRVAEKVKVVKPTRSLFNDHARFDAKKIAFKAKREVKRDLVDFIRYWWTEAIVVLLFNLHMNNVVHKMADVWPG